MSDKGRLVLLMIKRQSLLIITQACTCKTFVLLAMSDAVQRDIHILLPRITSTGEK